MSNFPTIESFFQPLSLSQPKKDKENETPPAKVGDGFTEDELAQALDPTSATWKPQGTYDEVGIGELSPGPRKAKITGRVVNFYEAATPSKMPTAANGYFKLIVKDDTGVLLVKLWFAHREYDAVLGSVVSLWTTHIFAVSKAPGSLAVPNPSLSVNIFPERDSSCCFMVLDPTERKNSCKVTPGYNWPPIPDLITLKQFMEGGSDIPNAKILVCVKSISPQKSGKYLLIFFSMCLGV